MNEEELAKARVEHEIKQSGLSRRRWYFWKYLRSKHWAGIRKRYFAIYKRICRHCKARKNIELHHINYRNIYDVTLNDVIPLCRFCHQKEHNRLIAKRLAKRKKARAFKRKIIDQKKKSANSRLLQKELKKFIRKYGTTNKIIP